MSEHLYYLRLRDGRWVTYSGTSGHDAAARYRMAPETGATPADDVLLWSETATSLFKLRERARQEAARV